jgi:hypothetical protein
MALTSLPAPLALAGAGQVKLRWRQTSPKIVSRLRSRPKGAQRWAASDVAPTRLKLPEREHQTAIARMAGRVATVFMLGLLLCGPGCSRKPSGGPASIHSYSEVNYASTESWYDFKLERGRKETGWVLLPEPTSDKHYVSGIDPHLRGFVRPEVCAECHQEIYDTFVKTSHFRTSEVARVNNVLGSFATGENELKTRDPNLDFKMVNDANGMRQCLTVREGDKRYTHEVPIDIVTGSGNHGQTYLYWRGDGLFQLPVSYFSELDRWVNSPGLYADGTADFARGIGERCLECHATYFAPAAGSFNRYDRQNYILGVTCVRCHGPGWAHLQYHQNHRDDDEARYIVNPGMLAVERANEVCAQCHSGEGQLHKPAFSYRPGEPLAEHISLDLSGESVQNDDPHAANQLARLMKSRCFTESPTLTCFTCHDPHQQERGNLALFANRCAKCHASDDCGLSAELGAGIKDRCVSCHMPSRREALGVMEMRDGIFLPLLRDHHIQARPPAMQEIVAEIRRELLKGRESPNGREAPPSDE